VVVHAYNPNYSGGRDRRNKVQGQPGQKLVRPYLKIKLGKVAHAVVPAMQEAEIGRLQSKADLGKSMRPYLKNKLKAKGLGVA
jgi:hypothetical protein